MECCMSARLPLCFSVWGSYVTPLFIFSVHEDLIHTACLRLQLSPGLPIVIPVLLLLQAPCSCLLEQSIQETKCHKRDCRKTFLSTLVKGQMLLVLQSMLLPAGTLVTFQRFLREEKLLAKRHK